LFGFKYLIFLLFLSAAPSFAYEFSGAAWPIESGPIFYVLHPAGSEDITDGSDLDAVNRAFHTWSCVLKSGLRLHEHHAAGPALLDLEDGFNTVFWSETEIQARENGMGPATLAITLGDIPLEGETHVVRESADITFNGFDHTWSVDGTKTDIESIAVHEVGHFIGFDHPCSDDEERNCLPVSESVLSPFYEGGQAHTLGPDDLKAALSVYEVGNGSTCSGPYGLYEPCVDDCECLEGLICAVHEDLTRCTQTCSNFSVGCPKSFICVLTVPDSSTGTARGLCKKSINNQAFKSGTVCEADGQCASGVCEWFPGLQRNICQEACGGGADCERDFFCHENICLAKNVYQGISCDTNSQESGCRCQDSRKTSSWLWLGIVFLFLRAQKKRLRVS